MARLVWAYQPLRELEGATGFVSVEDDALAEKLLEADKVQDPNIGARDLRPIEAEALGQDRESREYETRDTAAKPRGRRGK